MFLRAFGIAFLPVWGNIIDAQYVIYSFVDIVDLEANIVLFGFMSTFSIYQPEDPLPVNTFYSRSYEHKHSSLIFLSFC